MKIAAAISSLTPPSSPFPFFTLYRGWKYKIPLRVAWPSCLCIRKICKLNLFQFLFVSPRSSCASRNSFFFPSSSTCSPTAKTLLIRFPRKRFRRKGSERTVSPLWKFNAPKILGSPSTFRHELGGNKCFAFFQRLQILPVHATGLNDARSFLRFEKLSNWMCLVYLSKIKRINRPKEDKNKEKVNVQLWSLLVQVERSISNETVKYC